MKKEILLGLCCALAVPSLANAVEIPFYPAWAKGRIVVRNDLKADGDEESSLISRVGNVHRWPNDPLGAIASASHLPRSAPLLASDALSSSGVSIEASALSHLSGPEHVLHMGRKELDPVATAVSVPDQASTALLTGLTLFGLLAIKAKQRRTSENKT